MKPQHGTAHPSTDEALKLLAVRVEVDSEVLESLVNSLGEYYSKLLTVREVEELLSVSRQTIYRLIESGELTRVNVGPAARIPHPATVRR